MITLEQTKEILQANEENFKKINWGLEQITLNPEKAYGGVAGLWVIFEELQPQLFVRFVIRLHPTRLYHQSGSRRTGLGVAGIKF